MVPTLWVDHASVRVTDLAAASARLEASLGMVPTRSEAAPDRHSRLFLDRSYLEVGAEGEDAPGLGLYFFRFADLEALVRGLSAAGLTFHSQPYMGVDGVWDNLELQPPPGVPPPILVRRTQPPQLAADWPPSRPAAWPCGASRLQGFVLRVTRLDPAVTYFQALLGARVSGPLDRDPRTGSPRLDLRFGSDRLTLLEGGPPAIEAAVLECRSLAETAAFLTSRGTGFRSQPSELWVEDPLLPGPRWCFREPAGGLTQGP